MSTGESLPDDGQLAGQDTPLLTSSVQAPTEPNQAPSAREPGLSDEGGTAVAMESYRRTRRPTPRRFSRLADVIGSRRVAQLDAEDAARRQKAERVWITLQQRHLGAVATRLFDED